MCIDTALHRRQGQECSWTNTDCETTASPCFTTPVWIIQSVVSDFSFSTWHQPALLCLAFGLVTLCYHALVATSAMAQLVPSSVEAYILVAWLIPKANIE